MPATLDAKALKRKLRHETIDAAKKPLVPPGATSTTTPAGIAAHDRDADPDRWANRQRAREFAGELEGASHTASSDLRASAPPREESWQEQPAGAIAACDVAQLERHPDNRQPKEPDIVAMMQSFSDVGQRVGTRWRSRAGRRDDGAHPRSSARLDSDR